MSDRQRDHDDHDDRGGADGGEVPAPAGQPVWRRHVAESAVGLAVALLLLWVAVAAVSDVPFVYQGL